MSHSSWFPYQLKNDVLFANLIHLHSVIFSLHSHWHLSKELSSSFMRSLEGWKEKVRVAMCPCFVLGVCVYVNSGTLTFYLYLMLGSYLTYFLYVSHTLNLNELWCTQSFLLWSPRASWSVKCWEHHPHLLLLELICLQSSKFIITSFRILLKNKLKYFTCFPWSFYTIVCANLCILNSWSTSKHCDIEHQRITLIQTTYKLFCGLN